MKKHVTKKMLCLSLATMMGVTAFASCGGGGGGGSSETVNFWVSGTDAQLEMYYALADKFNDTYGAEHGIEANTVEVLASAYMGTVTNLIGTSTAPDVVLIGDAEYKKWIIGKYIADISDIESVHTDISLGEIEPLTINRLRYDVDTNTSNVDDPLYALPFDPQPTALYFNKGLMEQAGIIVISVDEEDMDKWNRGEIADNYGKKKSDYPSLANIDVPKKGYFRSIHPYFFDEFGDGWTPIDDGEIMVFNNRIAMNWDEVEDLAMLFSAETNPGSNGRSKYGTTYGYFTETWFNYGWSVGGDCLYDLTGEGKWNFGLLDPNANYIVKEGKTFTGRTGKVYQGGETIAFYDKMEASEGEVLVPDTKGDYYRAEGVTKDSNGYATAGTKAGIWSAIQAEMEKGDDSALLELPSTRTAFKRYLKLGCGTDTTNPNNIVEDSAGLNISPNPASVTDINPMYKQFYSGDILCFVGTSPLMQEISVYADEYNLVWDVAPIVQYKEYEKPDEPLEDAVKVRGIEAGHSTNSSMAVNRMSSKLDKAKAFVKWMCGLDGQRERAKLGFFPTQGSLIGELTFSGSYAPTNARVFAEALKYQRPGDWWYMPDTLWVEAWCIDLNNNVRNGKKSFAAWYEPAVIATNNRLKNYEKYDR